MPGSPILWAGRNRDFAWASVPASAPVSDLFIETLREDRQLYQNGTLWVPLEEREETLRWRDVRGVLQSSTLRIRSTRHGPLIEALSDDGGMAPRDSDEADRSRAARALAWTGARTGDGLTSMLSLMRLRSSDGVQTALADHDEPVLAVAYADRRGGGGVQVAGWIPRRPLPTGLVPVQGRLRSFDWRERVPIENLPGERLGEGPRPWVLAVDQPWPEAGGLEQLEWLWRPGQRAARLEAELERQAAAGPLDLRAAADFLQDDLAQRAPAVSAAILGLARRSGPLPPEAEEIAGLLSRWDGRMSADSAGAAAYQLVMERLIDDLLSGPFGKDLYQRYLEAPHVRPQYAIERLILRAAKLRRAGGWTDEARVSAAARSSLREAWVSLNHRLGPTRERWSWGGLHRVHFAPFGPYALTDPLVAHDFALRGSGQTLAYSRHRPAISFDVERAGFYRVAMDLAESDTLLSSLAPGQSEHPGHPHFADGLTRWTSARLSLFPTSRLVIEEENTERLVLEPAP
jgi:penicillin amidase